MAIGKILGAVQAGFGAVSANQRKQRNKGLIGRAYSQGRERLNLLQGDTRQSFGEGLVSRGLHLGGNVRASGAVPITNEGRRINVNEAFGHRNSQAGVISQGAPAVSVRNAYDLGSQQQTDLRREQQLEQNEMRTAYDTAIANNDAAGFNEQVNAIASGINTATGLDDALGNLNSVNSVQSAFGQPMKPPTPYPNAWGGVDPVDPLGRGAWAQPPGSVSDFNVFSDENRNRRG